jgi:2-dehydro-3-deoxygluconokinase
MEGDMLQMKETCKYALVVPTSMGIRMTPTKRQPFHVGENYFVQVTSAETNVASVISSLGMPVKVLTTFVKDSPIARMIQSDLAGRHMEYEGKEHPQGGPWGLRHQINMADSGYGLRGPKVYNDRAGEVGRLLSGTDFNLSRLFVEEGVGILHISGLIAALSPQTGEFCLELVRIARQNGTRVSFDLNYRASFWEHRQSQLLELFDEIASCSDILIGNEEDFQLCLSVKGPPSGGRNLAEQIEVFREMIEQVKQKYKNPTLYATTLREVMSANRHLWGAVLVNENEWQHIEPRPVDVLDRIGGGDGFVGGLLYSVLKGWDAKHSVRFAWACGALAVTLLTDYAMPENENQIWDIWEGDARVRR